VALNSSLTDICIVQDGETPPYAHKKSHRVRRPKLDENLAERITDPDSRVPVVNNDGQILTGDDAPFLRELDMWLEEHPSFTPLSEVLLFGHCLVELSFLEQVRGRKSVGHLASPVTPGKWSLAVKTV